MNHPVRFEFSQRMVSSTVFRGKTGIYRCIVGRKRASRFKFALGTARPFLPGSGRFVIADGVWRSETVREARRTEASLDERPFFPPLSSKFLPSPDLPPGITSVAGSGERSPTLPSHRRDFFSRFPIEIRSLCSVPIPECTLDLLEPSKFSKLFILILRRIVVESSWSSTELISLLYD